MKRYILLDRDGTVIVNKHYQKDPGITELESNAAAGLRLLRNAGFGLIILSNQSGIGRGFLTENDVAAVNASMERMLMQEMNATGSAVFDGIYCCPHVESDDCDCRKPRPGLARRAAKDLNFSLPDAYVIGDREADINLGKSVNAQTILVRTGYGAQTEADAFCSPDHTADNLLDAARWILS